MQQDYTISGGRNAMLLGGILRVCSDAFSSKSSHIEFCTNNYKQGRPIDFRCYSFSGKERDKETGYGYIPHQARQAHHGARYMDHELMTGWLSVDPLAPSCPSFPQPLKNIFAIPKNIRIFAFRKNKEE
jgi:hypothetical protein